jgi:glucosamine--fructose-6-phosphate aminotransferase (isomerizing)
MSYLEQEIAEQPDVIRRFLNEEMSNIQSIAAAVQEFDPAFVMIAARGTSDNAARYAQYWMGIEFGLPVALAAPSIHTLYKAQPRLSRALVLGISQSGHSQDVRQVIRDAGAQGAITLGITNDPESPLAQEAAFHICLRAGEEKSVAATKTYTAQLVALAALTVVLSADEAKIATLNKLPDMMADTLKQSAKMVTWVERYRYVDHMAVLGRGLNYCTAYEIALKIKELCYLTVEEYSEADFRHGPIAIIYAGFPVMVVAPSGETLHLMKDLLGKLVEQEAECIVLSDDLCFRQESCAFAA